MLTVDVTPQVWRRLLEVRRGVSCTCCGDWTAGERAALDLYGPLARRDLGPTIAAQIGQSLDGRVATVTGDARDVSGPDGLAHLHRMRALADAVVIGVRTALHDIPRLTVRLCDGPNPARVVIDPRGRLPDDAPLLSEDDGTRRIVIQAVDRHRPGTVEVIRLEAHEGEIDAGDIATALHEIGFQSLLVEGGGTTIARFLEAQLLTRIQLAIAPLLIGDGPQGLTLPTATERLADAIRPETRAFSLGSDVVFDCGLNEKAALTTEPVHGEPGAQTAAGQALNTSATETSMELPTGRYRHYKGGEYDVCGVARHSESNERLVVYRPRYGDRELWVRPLGMFLETVNVNGEEVPRFRLVATDRD